MRLTRRLVLVGHGSGRLPGRGQRLLRRRRKVTGFLVHARKRRRRVPRLRRCSVAHSSSSLLARWRPEACCEWLDCERTGALRELLPFERGREALCELRWEPCWPDFDEDCFVMSDKLHSIGFTRTAGSRIPSASDASLRPCLGGTIATGGLQRWGTCLGCLCRPWLVGSATLRRADLSQDTCQAGAPRRALSDKGLRAAPARTRCNLQNRHIPDCKMPRN